MSLHVSEKVCEFCGCSLKVDKIRYVLKYNIPYLSLVILLLLVCEIALPLNPLQENIIHLADKFILLVFLLDIGLDKYLHHGQYRHFLRRRTIDILFVLPLLKTLRCFEAVPFIGRAFRGMHAMQHVAYIDSRLFFDLDKAGHIAKYAKYAYPAILRK
ncbi:MAG: hypothetical protein DRN71_00110 [Candidatus Nanohalarchaeota archaeon]|nr:MAG: hypothetical protein DRN71_00110 [Candidatus Nanohaloarchaeota archaeon]